MAEYHFDGNMHCADFVAGDKSVTHYGFTAADVEKIIEKMLGMVSSGGVFLPQKENQEVLSIEVKGEKLSFHPGAVNRLANSCNERNYLLSLTVNQEYQRWAARFVPLSGKMDIRQVIEGFPMAFTEIIIHTAEDGIQTQPSTRKLESISEALSLHGAFVILGEPGAGKTTTQQQIAYDAALTLLQGKPARTPLFIRLSQQNDKDPYTFLKEEWERRTGTVFNNALSAGRILILADGINEIPSDKRNNCLKAWRVFEQEYRGQNQLIFSGRTLDYTNQLNLPRVQVDPLDAPRIEEFLKKHQAEGLINLINDPDNKLSELAKNPLNLFVLAMVYHESGKNTQILSNRGKLFQSFTQELIRKEELWHDIGLSPSKKIDLFSRLAYAMQQRGVGTIFDLNSAKDALPDNIITDLGEEIPLNKPVFFRFGRGSTILDPVTIPNIRFYHHLLQEYFAARELLRRFNAGETLDFIWKAKRLEEEMPAADVGDWDPLPEPPGTGWEVTTILAAGLALKPLNLIKAIFKVNPILAGRCFDEAGIESQKDLAELKETLQKQLLDDLYNPKIHLRTRLMSGAVLGKIGDPRFPVKEVDGIKVISPTMVEVPAGVYTIGSTAKDKDAFYNEKPPINLRLETFQIGKWPVTNAEYACFMQAGGYENEDYWQTELARRWLKGEDVMGGQFSAWLENWEILQGLSDARKTLEATGNFSPQRIDFYVYVAGLTKEELKKYLEKSLSQKSRSQPDFLGDDRFNNPSQPVVGITWFEANAYCAWLSMVLKRNYRLPSEAEWEAAARGFEKKDTPRKYLWGNDWIPNQANSIEGRVQKTSPVGVYTAAGNLGPFKTEDQAGNVWEWTNSLFLPYPYDAQQTEILEKEGERTLRGGSWGNVHRDLRAAYRVGYVPDYVSNDLGFRLLSPGPDSES